MASIIFYGVGRNAQENVEKWIDKGFSPVCFSDADTKKHYTKFQQWNVLPLLEAIRKYPDYELYCTQNSSSLSQVRSFLLSVGIPDDRIHFFEEYVGNEIKTVSSLYPQLHTIYNALQDDLSRTLFWGRIQYSLSHKLTGIYKAMICDDNMKWLMTKKTYAEIRYGLPGLWEALKENQPKQKNKLFLMAFDEAWNEFEWVLDRFLEAMSEMNIIFSGCVMPYAKELPKVYKGIPCVSEEVFINSIDETTKVVVGIPGWCVEVRDVVERYASIAGILYPIADTAHPQYIETDFWTPQENEIFVDVGVYDLQNSIDFVQWAKNGFEKIYAFEPDPKGYEVATKKIKELPIFNNKIELINKGLSAKNGTLKFPAEYKGSGMHDGEFIDVEVVSLDSYLQGKPVTFVKMDVEGAEMDVLLGMQQTIALHKPKMAVCIYHNHQDIFEVATFLLSIVPQYHFYLRHYNSNETECVLFAYYDKAKELCGD
ncbi:MAG: FkbM family methyltransferase [Lachnospiraceae bacterium]|nr:FkbM family methyltransferase [Lachnospiraceae bacterium]